MAIGDRREKLERSSLITVKSEIRNSTLHFTFAKSVIQTMAIFAIMPRIYQVSALWIRGVSTASVFTTNTKRARRS